MLSYNHIINCL